MSKHGADGCSERMGQTAYRSACRKAVINAPTPPAPQPVEKVGETTAQPASEGEDIPPWVKEQMDELLPMVRQGRDAKGQIEAWEAVCAAVHEDPNYKFEGMPSIKATPAYIRNLRAEANRLRERVKELEQRSGLVHPPECKCVVCVHG